VGLEEIYLFSINNREVWMFKDKYIALKIGITIILVLVVIAFFTKDTRTPLSADIVPGNGSAEGLATDLLDWLNNADKQQVGELAEISAKSHAQLNNLQSIDIDSMNSTWSRILDKLAQSKQAVTFKIASERILDKTIYKDYNGQSVSKERYDQIRQGLQNKLEKELDKDKVIQRYEQTVTPSDELVKRWDKMFDKVMEEADRRMPPIEYTYKNLMYVEYKLKDNTEIKVYIKQTGDRYYLDESMYPDVISTDEKSTGDEHENFRQDHLTCLA
jgi:hypothetical protein